MPGMLFGNECTDLILKTEKSDTCPKWLCLRYQTLDMVTPGRLERPTN